MNNSNTKKYILVFLITAAMFGTAFSISNYINDKKLSDIKSIEDHISVSILSLETQFELLQESTCENIHNSSLSDELGVLAEKLAFAESQNEISAKEVEGLKKYYSLLEIKDYLLTKKISKQCKLQPITIIYLYSNKEDCDKCREQGYVLTYLRENYPDIRVYSFDYNLDLPAIKTLIKINDAKKQLPIVILNERVYNGFQSLEKMENLIKPLLPKSTSTPIKK